MKTYSKTTKAISLKAQPANTSRRNGSVQLANITDKHISALDKIANSSSKVVTQTKINPEEEELMQGKFMTAQLAAAPEEEELKQGKFETMQRQGLEDEELLQGKFNITQLEATDVEEELMQGQFKTAQRQESEDEEMLQGKFKTAQLAASLEEEELLQGKFKTIQKQTLEEEEPLQGKFASVSSIFQKQEHAAPPRNNTGLPDNLKSGIENLSGYSMDNVKVHYNSARPAQLNAHAYAQGTDIHLASGQEKHLPHEAWHVVQQKQGRVNPTLQMKGGISVNDDKGLEAEADVMGMKALQMKYSDNNSTESLGSDSLSQRTQYNIRHRTLIKTNYGNNVGQTTQCEFIAYGATAWEDEGVGRSKNAGIKNITKDFEGQEGVTCHFHANGTKGTEFDSFTATFTYMVAYKNFSPFEEKIHYNIDGTIENMQGKWDKRVPPKWAAEAVKLAEDKLKSLCE